MIIITFAMSFSVCTLLVEYDLVSVSVITFNTKEVTKITFRYTISQFTVYRYIYITCRKEIGIIKS